MNSRPAHPFAAETGAATYERCPVEPLAQEAGACLRATGRLGNSLDGEPLADAAGGPAGRRVSVDAARLGLYNRLNAIEEMATHRQAQTARAALFQLGVLADKVAAIAMLADDHPNVRESGLANDAAAAASRLISSIRAVLELHAGTTLAEMFGDYYLDPGADLLAAEASQMICAE